MNRRGHLSSKIPNVKLRPARSGPGGAGARRKEASPLNAMDQEIIDQAMAAAEDDETSNAALRITSRPWSKVVMTFTGVEEKPRLAQMAKELGASVESALTVHVTHVVSTGFASAKYLYAVEHRLPIMTPSWIEHAHAAWLAGEEFGVEESMEGRRLPAFLGLVISISGIEPVERRKEVINLITLNGGTYAKDLDRTCTHLVSTTPTNIRAPSQKVKWAVKELAHRDSLQRAGKKVEGEDMKIVYEDWIWDCVGYGGRWKEDWYDARKVRRTPRTSAEEVLSGKVSPNVSVKKSTSDQSGQDKIEPAVLRKRKRGDLDNLVGEIFSTSTTAKQDGPLSDGQKPSIEAGEPEAHAGTENDAALPDAHGVAASRVGPREIPIDTPVETRPSVLHTSRTASFAGPSAKPVSSIPPTHPDAAAAMIEPAEKRPKSDLQGIPQIFQGKRFTPLISEDTRVLEKALRAHGGKIVGEADRKQGQETDYVIVRLSSNTRVDEVFGQQPEIVTECWVEGCCFVQRLLPLNEHVVFRPLQGGFPIPGAATMQVHLSGFSTENAVYLRRLLRALGLTVSTKMSRHSTHLVCAEPSGIKYTKALEWGVRVVRDTWLMAMSRSARLEPESEHAHDPAVAASETGLQRPSSALMATDKANMGAVTDGMRDVGLKSSQQSQSPTKTAKGQIEALSQARMLQATPTHIDVLEGPDVDAKAEADRSIMLATTTSRILSSVDSLPRDPASSTVTEAQRRHHTEPLHSDVGGGAMKEASLPRTTSAPVPAAGFGTKSVSSSSTSASTKVPLGSNGSAGSMASLSGLAKPEVSEMLKLLAQDDPATPTSTSGFLKPSARRRPASRLRTSVPLSARAASPGNTTGDTTRMFTPSPPYGGNADEAGRREEEEMEVDTSDVLGGTTRRTGFAGARTAGGMGYAGVGEMLLDGLSGMGGFEESVRVDIVDPVAARERKRIQDLFKRPALEAERRAQTGGEAVGTVSVSKKNKPRR